MMILPLADALMNCLQNLTSRIAGVDDEQMTNRAMGMGTMLGFGIGAVKEQFGTSSSNIKTGNSDNNQDGGIKNFMSKAKEVVSPNINLTAESDYHGNVNPIRDVIPKESKEIKETKTNTMSVPTPSDNNKSYMANENQVTPKSTISKVAHTGIQATKAYLEIGAKMAEGDFNKSSYKPSPNNRKSNFQNTAYTQYADKMTGNNSFKKLGDENEPKE